MEATRNSHCSHCGAQFAEGQAWPRRCPSCGRFSYSNPIPVGVLLVPVATRAGLGLLLIRRAIDPGRGAFALPGGFLTTGESWQVGAVREVMEETGIELSPESVSLHAVRSTPNGAELIVFGSVPPISEAALGGFRATDETDALRVATVPEPLAFSLHTEVATAWLRVNGSG